MATGAPSSRHPSVPIRFRRNVANLSVDQLKLRQRRNMVDAGRWREGDELREVHPTEFADAEHIRFRVLTTNGVQYTGASTEDFAVDEL